MRLVIADDHRLLLEALATALADMGYVVEAAVTTAAEALRAVALHDPDMLLVDVCFPVGSGLDVARQVVSRHPRTRVVMLTGTESEEMFTAALQIGVAGYTRKAQRVEAIADALEAAATGTPAVDRDMLRVLRHRHPVVPRQRGLLDRLTPRERHVLGLLVDGLSTKDIVGQLSVSESTIRSHVQSIFSKFGVHSRLQAVALLNQEGALHGMEGSYVFGE